MNQKIGILAALILPLLLSACVTGSSKSGNSTARISEVEGNAEISRNGGHWESARLWQTLRSGDRAKAGSNGKIDFHLGKYGGVLTLMPESMIEFQQLGPVPAGSQIVAIINLTEGRVVGDTLKLPPNTRIQIKTRGGTHEIP